MKNSSAGWDEIPANVTKICIDVYIEPSTHIIHKYFKEGIFPSELKLAKVVSIFKSGNSSKIPNYRPISDLSFLFEKVMYNHISDFIESFNVLYEYQSGFRQRHSTQQAIITLVNKITSSLDTGDLVIGVFLDLNKGFWHCWQQTTLGYTACIWHQEKHMDMVSQLPIKQISVRFLWWYSVYNTIYKLGCPTGFYTWPSFIYYLYEWYM